MLIEAVTVCVNYSDFLEHTLPRNKKHFDDFCVVTIADDIKTINLCNSLKIKTVITDRLYENGAAFNKGKAINDGFAILDKSDWMIHLDADTILHDDFRDKLNLMALDKDFIYGCGRHLCPSYDSWNRYARTGRCRPKWQYQGRPKNIGVGFLQLFNAKSDTIINTVGPWYPEEYGHAGRSDRVFLRKWANKIRKLENISVIQLESEASAMGANWNGRKTPVFAPVNRTLVS